MRALILICYLHGDGWDGTSSVLRLVELMDGLMADWPLSHGNTLLRRLHTSRDSLLLCT